MRALANRIVHARKFDYLLVALISANAIMQGVRLSFDPEPDWLPYLTAPFWILMMPSALFGSASQDVCALAEGRPVFQGSLERLRLLCVWFSDHLHNPLRRDGHQLRAAHPFGALVATSSSPPNRQGNALDPGDTVALHTEHGPHRAAAGIVVYSYAVVGLKSFREHDPAHWGSLGVSVLTLFEIVTLEGWVDVMRPLVKVEPLAWLYFVSFVIISAYLVTNVFIAVVIRNLEQSMQERQQASAAPASREEILRELRSTQQSLRRLEERLQQLPD